MMRRRVVSLAFLIAALGTSAYANEPKPLAAGVPTLEQHLLLGDLLLHSDYRPSAEVKARLLREGKTFDQSAPVFMPPKRAAGMPIQTVGEVAVLIGDDETVTTFDGGKYGLSYDNTRQDPMAVTERFLDQFGDQYDFVAVWTSFWDYGADGLAYYVPIYNDTTGIGEQRYDQRGYWGSAGKLQGFLNMKSIEVYGNISREDNYVYPVIGQEFSHRWLAQMLFRAPNGQASEAMLGRDGAHWSSLLQADASVQDGNQWQDLGDGSFKQLANMARYSPLDLYGMGLYGPDEVPPFFLIENATYRGKAVNGLTTFPGGVTVNGTRTDITIEDVIAASGVRKPSVVDSQKDFRMGFLLVTEPGQSVEAVQDQIDQIEAFRVIWEKKYAEWTHGRSSMCTRVTANCDRPSLRITSTSAHELVGDGDDMAEPGETVAVSVTIANQGGGTAPAARVHFSAPDGSDLTIANTPYVLGDIESGGSMSATNQITITIGQDAPCGSDVKLLVEAVTGDLLTTGELLVPIGYRFLFYDDFNTDKGWSVNAQGMDTANAGNFERSSPVGVNSSRYGLDFQVQAEADQSGGGMAFVTGAATGQGLGGNDVDGGQTSVTSPSIPLGEARDPWVGYYSWRTGLDFNSVPGSVVSDDNDPFVVEVSPDAGATWLKIDGDISNDQRWAEKRFRVLDFLPTVPATLQLRFTVVDADPQSLTEAGFDMVRVWDLEASCFELPVTPETPETPETPVTPETPETPETPVTPAVKGVQSSGCGAGELPALSLAALGLLALRRMRRRA